MSQDSVLASLQAPLTDDRDNDMLALIMRSLLVGAEELLNRQLEPYLRGQLAIPSSEVITQGESAPTHNIFAEQTLGRVDHQCRHAPNAIFDFIDGKVKFTKNGIATWLDDQAEEEQKKVFDFVVGRGRDMRALHKKREGVIMEALSVRQI
ncbi:hypothetical protein NP493_1021g00014 [Ridgeia piscesae]|uniref:Uncharacterized protein n=1 Tax=Ridgeia piscesae TaxID=27915 RepID=A0AAD9KIJ4_RIDPI|nr:hypothetical protein NP493_1021g00014 [Ridgeia piscesae]